MGVSEIEYRGREFSASDAVLQVWLRLLVDEFDKREERPQWLNEIRENWYTQATEHFSYGIVLALDGCLSQPGRREIILEAAKRALSRLKSFGDPIPVATLNALTGDSSFARDLSSEEVVEPAEDFVDLLEDDADPDSGIEPVITQQDLLRAIDSHARWVADSTTGKRLKLTDARIPSADLSGVCLVRARLTRVDLRGVNLTDAKLFRTDLDQVDIEGAVLRNVEFHKVKIRGCNFNRVSAEGAKISGTRTEDTSFQHARLNRTTITGSTFFRVSMTGAVLTNSRLQCTMSGDLRGCDFSGSDLRRSDFRGVDLRDTTFTDTLLVRTGFKRVRLSGAHGVPFLADEIGGSELDFSPAGDGSTLGTLAMLREQLAGGIGSGPWGSATAHELYRPLQVEDGVARYLSIERRSDGIEVIRVQQPVLQRRSLTIHYQILDPRFVDVLAQDLIFSLLLSGLGQHEFRDRVDEINYKNTQTGFERSRAYRRL